MCRMGMRNMRSSEARSTGVSCVVLVGAGGFAVPVLREDALMGVVFLGVEDWFPAPVGSGLGCACCARGDGLPRGTLGFRFLLITGGW